MSDISKDDGLHTEDHDAWDLGGYCNEMVMRDGDADVCSYRRETGAQAPAWRPEGNHWRWSPVLSEWFPCRCDLRDNHGQPDGFLQTGRRSILPPEPKGGWPCERHEAHGRHPYNHAGDGSQCAAEECGGTRLDPCYSTETCPGVKAHPLTMIGRAG